MNRKDFEIKNGILKTYAGDGGEVTVPDGVTGMENGAFLGCRGLADANGMVIVRNVLFDYYGKGGLVTIPDGVTSIGYEAFYHCRRLTGVIIPVGVTSIRDWAFSDCVSLTSVTIPDGVTSIGKETFYGCRRLTGMTVPDSVRTIGKKAFPSEMKLRSCTLAPTSADGEQAKMLLKAFGAQNLALPFLLDALQTNTILKKKVHNRVKNKTFREKFIPALIADGEPQALEKMLSLVKMREPEEIDRYIAMAENNAEIRAMLLEYKNRLYPPEILEKMKEIQTEKDFGIREKTLADYKKLFSIKKQDGVYVITKYKGESDTVTVPAAIKGISVRFSLKRCATVKTVYLEEGIAQIEEKAFSKCSSLQNVTVPKSVKSIGKEAFCYCKALVNLRFTGSKAAWQAIEKGERWNAYVPAQTVVCADGEIKSE